MRKITAPDGKYTIIASREEADVSWPIRRISCTTIQPYVAANFTAEGVAIGGKTMTAREVDQLTKKCRELNLAIEELA